MNRKIAAFAIGFAVLSVFGAFAAGPGGLGAIGIYGSAGSTGGVGSGSAGVSLKWASFPVIGVKYDFSAALVNVSCDYYAVDAEPLGSGFTYFLGAGAYVGFASGSDLALGLRLPAGLQYWPIKKLEVYLSPVLSMPIFPKLDFGFGGELGVRVHL
jgi:hypothetical protein